MWTPSLEPIGSSATGLGSNAVPLGQAQAQIGEGSSVEGSLPTRGAAGEEDQVQTHEHGFGRGLGQSSTVDDGSFEQGQVQHHSAYEA